MPMISLIIIFFLLDCDYITPQILALNTGDTLSLRGHADATKPSGVAYYTTINIVLTVPGLSADI